MLVASSQTCQPFPEYLRRSPVKSFTGLWHLWNQIIQLMQFSRYKRDFFECPFTYYNLETPKCCSLQKILSLIKPDRRILPTSFCNNLQKVFIRICTFAFMRTFIVLSFQFAFMRMSSILFASMRIFLFTFLVFGSKMALSKRKLEI